MTFLSFLYQLILTVVSGWFARPQIDTTAWNNQAAQAMLKSVKDADKLQVQINQTPIPTADTPADWNKGAGP